MAELRRRLGAADAYGFADDASVGSSSEPSGEVISLIQSGHKIQAIKRYREETGLGLKEAKDAVERYEQLYGSR